MGGRCALVVGSHVDVASPGERRPKVKVPSISRLCLGYSQKGHSCLAVLLARKITDVHNYLFGLYVATCLSSYPASLFGSHISRHDQP